MQMILGFVDPYLRLDPEEDRKYKSGADLTPFWLSWRGALEYHLKNLLGFLALGHASV